MIMFSDNIQLLIDLITFYPMNITLKIAALSEDTFLTNMRTDVALQKSPRNTRKVSGSISMLIEPIVLPGLTILKSTLLR